MFCVLNVVPDEKTWFGRIKNIFQKPCVNIDLVPVCGGKSFCCVTTKRYKGELPWQKIKEATADLGEMIVPFDVKLPKEYEIKEFKAKELPDIILMNSALKAIKKQALNPQEIRIAVIDKKAVYTQSIANLAPLASCVCVVCEQTEKYEALSQKLMEAYGLSLIIKEKADESIIDYDFIISNESELVPLRFKGTAFCKEKKRLLSGTCLVGGGISLPCEYEELWQGKINKLQFASALFELCGVSELKNMCFNEMCC